MKIFYAALLCIILLLTAITISLRSESTNFYGIADAQENVIADEFTVEIKKQHIVPGQRIAIGDTLVELNTPELDLKIAQTTRDLKELTTQKSAHAKMTISEVAQQKTEQAATVNTLHGQIRELEAQLETNRKLVAELRSVKKGETDPNDNSDMANPIMVKIQELKKALDLALDSSNISMRRLNNELSYEGDPLAERVKGLQKELDILMEAKRQSTKTSPINGIVGAVCFKEGEKVSSFTPLCSLHCASPSFVRGYIHENAYSKVSVGQRVRVSSCTGKKTDFAGEIIGVGARIVEYPVRLRKTPDMLMWGREVTIKIPEMNTFLLGEKVLISIVDNTPKTRGRVSGIPLFGNPLYAAESKVPASPLPALRDITYPRAEKDQPGIEASGILYLSDIGKYLLISDETKEKRPALFLMDATGKIEKEILIAGLEKINDMEGLAEDDAGSRLYVLTSQSYNKKGVLSAARRSFLLVKRDGEALTLEKRIDLFGVLEASARSAPDDPWASFILKAIADSTLDIEGVAFRRNTLFLGFKNPQLEARAVILVISNADLLFGESPSRGADIALWKKWDLSDPVGGAAGGISDIYFAGDTLYVLSVAEKTGTEKAIGILWRYSMSTDRLECMQRFPGLKPEGIALNKRLNELLVTFDNGSYSASQLLTIKVDK